MKRKNIIICLLSFLLLMSSINITVFAKTQDYQRSNYNPDDYSSKFTINGYTVYSKKGVLSVKNNKTKKTKILEKSSVDMRFLTNGKYIYYSIQSKLYRIKMDGTGKKYVATIKDAFSLKTYIDNKFFYTKTNKKDQTRDDFYSYDIKRKKSKKVMNNVGNILTCGKYILGMPSSGSYMPLWCSSINSQTNKQVRISNNTFFPSTQNGKIYYVELTGSPLEPICIVKSCNPNGSNKKAISKKFRVNQYNIYGRITSTYVYYYNMVSPNWQNRYYRFNYKTMKQERISKNKWQGNTLGY